MKMKKFTTGLLIASMAAAMMMGCGEPKDETTAPETVV